MDEATRLSVVDSKLDFDGIAVNSYRASVAADFIRHRLLAVGISFTFETVMTSLDKVAFLQKAQQQGFRTYLYFVATEDSEINLSRMAYRVKTGGHPVPRDKVLSRYQRSLGLLPDAISHSNRA
nr:zeta toxin family protein [uncultured Pseudogulbenkiania sp.]